MPCIDVKKYPLPVPFPQDNTGLNPNNSALFRNFAVQRQFFFPRLTKRLSPQKQILRKFAGYNPEVYLRLAGKSVLCTLNSHSINLCSAQKIKLSPFSRKTNAYPPSGCCRFPSFPAPIFLSVQPKPGNQKDRKSTRLNSS